MEVRLRCSTLHCTNPVTRFCLCRTEKPAFCSNCAGTHASSVDGWHSIVSIEVFECVSNLQELHEYHLRNTATKEVIQLLEQTATQLELEKQTSKTTIEALYKKKKTQLKTFFEDNLWNYTKLFDDLLTEVKLMRNEMKKTELDPNTQLSETAKRMVSTIVHLQERSKEFVPVREEIDKRAVVFTIENPVTASDTLSCIFPDSEPIICECPNCTRIHSGLNAGRTHSLFEENEGYVQVKPVLKKREKHKGTELEDSAPSKKACIQCKEDEPQGSTELDSESLDEPIDALLQDPGLFLIPFVRSNQLCTMNCHSREISKRCVFSLDTKVDSGSRSVMLSDDGVFTCGSNSLQTGFCAFLIDRSGTVAQQANMVNRRYAHGLIGYPGSDLKNVYAFGGGDACAGKTCEAFGLDTRIWETLPEMHYSRSHFNPCLFITDIYLCGGTSTHSIEVFSPQSKQFSVLPISLPATLDECYSVASEKEIIVVGRKKVTNLQLDSDGKLTVRVINAKNYPKKSAIANPIRRGDEVFFVTYGRAGKYQLNKSRFETIKSFIRDF